MSLISTGTNAVMYVTYGLARRNNRTSVCMRISALANACRRIQAYANVCQLMPTYANVCRRIPAYVPHIRSPYSPPSHMYRITPSLYNPSLPPLHMNRITPSLYTIIAPLPLSTCLQQTPVDINKYPLHECLAESSLLA